ncbi:dihydrolipoamide acetyltransferase family protein [Bellilinea sp.]
MPTEILMPKIGLNMREGLLVEWLVEEGQQVKKGQPVYVVETDKVTNEVLAEEDGILHRLVEAGNMVPVAGVVGYILQPDEPIPAAPSLTSSITEEKKEPLIVEKSHLGGSQEGEMPAQVADIQATPAVRRRAKELGIDLARVVSFKKSNKISIEDVEEFSTKMQNLVDSGSFRVTPIAQKMAKEWGIDLSMIQPMDGEKITRRDVENALERHSKSAERIEPSSEQPLPSVSLKSGIRGLIAERMMAGANNTAPVTLFSEVDASELYDLRTFYNKNLASQQGHEISFDALLIKFIALGLKECPYMNVTVMNDRIVQLKNINIGFALDTSRGLVVPVVKNPLEKSILEISQEIEDLKRRGLDGRLVPDDLEGGTFTITNLGMYNIDAFTPIIRLPETAILGVGRIVLRPSEYHGNICLRRRMTLSLTFDHRVVDGAPAARFLKKVGDFIEHPGSLVVGF